LGKVEEGRGNGGDGGKTHGGNFGFECYSAAKLAGKMMVLLGLWGFALFGPCC
nr:hypothetical protein [Tanacetum cinerariifolium]